MNSQTFKPKFQTVPLADGLKWRGGGNYLYQQKLDGCWHELDFDGSILVGERMPDGTFWPFDVCILQGADVRRRPLVERIEMLDSLRPVFPSHFRRVPHGSGGEFLEHVIASGGEGIVCKPLDAPYGIGWIKCKRVETFDCRVVAKNPSKLSLHLSLDGQDVGWCPCRGMFDEIHIGDVVEVRCHSRHPSGRLREAKFERVRCDKHPMEVKS